MSSDEHRLAIYRRYVTLAREHWGNNSAGLAQGAHVHELAPGLS